MKTHIEWKSWNQAITDIRKSHRLNQKDLAKEFCFSQQQMTRIETGKVEPCMDFIYKFCCKFKVDVGWLLFGEGVRKSYEAITEFDFDHIETRVLKKVLCHRLQHVEACVRSYDSLCEERLQDVTTYQEATEIREKAVNDSIPSFAPEWLIKDAKDAIPFSGLKDNHEGI